MEKYAGCRKQESSRREQETMSPEGNGMTAGRLKVCFIRFDAGAAFSLYQKVRSKILRTTFYFLHFMVE